ncbi:DUF4240 domain-containing protein [Streptomyces hirsutus]|uniref:DUF4240 domain-containing protein n=1 Tax=Streptomyces hirsutus TaxID=35620 RepID=UPI0033ECF3D9
MDIGTFWNVIEAARAGAAETGKPFDEVLVEQLADRPQQEILEYAERFDELHDALYRWDVWAGCLPHRRRVLRRQFHGLPSWCDRFGPSVVPARGR